MAKVKTAKRPSKAAAASKRNGRAGGRPTLFPGKTAKPTWTVTPAAVAKARADAEQIGCSPSDAVVAAILEFDAHAYMDRRDALGPTPSRSAPTITRRTVRSQ